MSEILGVIFKSVLALLGVAIVVTISYRGFNNHKDSSAIAQLSQLAFNIQAGYPNGSFTSLTNAVAVIGDKGSKFAPEDMISGGTLVNPWGGAVTLNVNATNAANFDVTTAGVSVSGCQKYATNMDTALKLSINGTAQTLPLDSGAALAACQNSPNTLVLTFGH